MRTGQTFSWTSRYMIFVLSNYTDSSPKLFRIFLYFSSQLPICVGMVIIQMLVYYTTPVYLFIYRTASPHFVVCLYSRHYNLILCRGRLQVDRYAKKVDLRAIVHCLTHRYPHRTFCFYIWQVFVVALSMFILIEGA